LREHGYDIWPVNPAFTGVELHGRPTLATLAEISVAVDLVDVFRRSEHLPAHVDDILAMSPRPAAVWLQLGITNDAVARVLHSHGIEVVQDRCTLAEHRRLGLG
jgi:predicted CoA-binding protein